MSKGGNKVDGSNVFSNLEDFRCGVVKENDALRLGDYPRGSVLRFGEKQIYCATTMPGRLATDH
jgi:hypothetical protein